MKILIIKLGARGDVLRTSSILPALSAKYPSAEIIWLTGKKSAGILEGNPYIADIITDTSGIMKKPWQKSVDMVINLDEDPGAAAIASETDCQKTGFYLEGGRLLASGTFENIWRMGAYGPRPYNDRLKKGNKLTYQRLLYDALDLGAEIHRPYIAMSGEETAWAKDFLGADKKAVGINFSSSLLWPAKRLPVAAVKELSDLIGAEGYRPVIFGASDEAAETGILRSVLKDAGFACGLPLRKFIAVINECAALVTTDSFALHAAAALGTYSVSLFGPTSAAEAEVYGAGRKFVTPLECSCCYKKTCAVKPHCMDVFNMRETVCAVKAGLDFTVCT